MSSMPDRYDAVIVGARVAGAATAMLLARAGLKVLVLDRGRYGTDTVSTHALMRGAVRQLARWGLLPALEAAGTPPIRSTTFHYPPESVRIAIKPKHDVSFLLAPRRAVLDRVLVDAARIAGAEVRYETGVRAIQRAADGRVIGLVTHDQDGHALDVRAEVVIGADGVRSSVAQLVGAPVLREGRHAAAVLYGYWPGLECDGVHWHWAEGAAAGVIPTNDGECCVFVSVPSERFAREFAHDLRGGYHRLLRYVAPAVADQVGWLRAAPTLHGFGGERSFMRQCSGPGWALVGDAGYFKDPITAHGITDAFRDAELLAGELLGGPRASGDYQRMRDHLSTGLFDVTNRIASFAWDFRILRELHEQLSDEMEREVEAMIEGGRPCEIHT